MRRWLALAPLLALAAIVTLGGLALLRGGQEDRFGPSALIGKPAPAFALEALDGGEAIVSEEFAGRAFVINFYASWCAPCRLEHPLLMQLRQAGVPILGIAYKDGAAASQAFLAQLGDPFEAAGLDGQGRLALEFGVRKVPETFVIDSAGVIVAHRAGPVDAGFVQRAILPAVGPAAVRDEPSRGP